jgi:hypothetical protein
MAANETDEALARAYLNLRRVIGILGVALPIVLMIWGSVLAGSFHVERSLSDYYSLRTRDVFVGILFAIAWFLLTYRYEKRDNIAGDLACVFALGVALFSNRGSHWESVIHFSCAVALFLVLAYFSLLLFTRSKGHKTPRKKLRNRIYIACGAAILACIALIGLYNWWWRQTVLATLNPVFWLESIALWAFGFSWFVKGETLLKDRET